MVLAQVTYCLTKHIEVLETDIKYEKARSLQLERTFAEENKQKILAEARLEVKIDEMQKTLTKYENVIKKQEQKIKYLETSLTEQFSRFCSWQKQDVVRQVNKCVNVVSDLKTVTPYLTSTSIPTIDMCRANMSQWNEHLGNVKKYSEALDNYYSSVFNQVCNDEYPLKLNQPELFTDIFELRYILHDNYIPVINLFTNPQRPNFPPPPMAMPNNHGIWYGKCFSAAGAIVPRNYYNNSLEGTALYKSQLNQNGLPYTPIPPNTDSNRFISEVSSKMINCSANTQTTSKISEIEPNASIEIPTKSTEPETNEEHAAPTNTSKNLESTLSSLTITNRDSECKDVSHDWETNKASVKESNTVRITETTEPSCSYADKENDLVNLNELVKNKENRHISDTAKAIGGPKFYNLFLYVKKKITNVGEEALLNALKNVRQKKIKLSGMTREDIVKALLDELKSTSETQEIVNKPAWGTIKTTFNNWEKDVSDNVCVICYDTYDMESVTKLKCQHSFHSSCVRKWFATNSICPICRLHTTTDEDFPPLS
ncbi:hypothetical protein FQR65_LT02416 [Abscondita terminalis]|nr:hypothetical protein FQR65_LT02416 [Abscondita terminalis]